MSLQPFAPGQIQAGSHVVTFGGNLKLESRIDPITSQLIKTQDAALEVMKLIESGAAKQFLESQQAMPSVTWLGDLVDRLFGWGKYHSEINKRDIGRKRIVEDKQAALQRGHCPDNFVFRDYINTSFESQIFPNRSCSLIEPIEYGVNIIQYIWRNIQSPDDIICKVGYCVTERLNDCYPDCFPCLNASEVEKNAMINATYSSLRYASKYDANVTWSIYIFKHYHKLNRWKVDQLVNVFNRTIAICENQIYDPNPPSGISSYAYYSLLIIPVVITGGVIFEVYRHNRKKQYIPLKSIDEIL